jgi:UDP-2,3-diacylglucosamine pyrophosphatase LpxH
MFTSRRLSSAFRLAQEIPFDDSSKFIFFSDCHRGDNSWADDFAHNQNLYSHALDRYYREGFTYIEIGDGDELWENRRFEDVRAAHSHVFRLLRKFHEKNRLYLIFGNHDKEKKYQKNVEETLHRFFDEKSRQYRNLFDGIRVHEGLVLVNSANRNKIFLVHGHQGELLSDQVWWLGRFLGRNLWRHLQLLGIRDPTRPAKNYNKRRKVERRITKWVKTRNYLVITGHTHRPRFPDTDAPPYFNDGSCVHPRSITGIEIQNGEILLIKWWLKTRDDGTLFVTRDVLAGPKRLSLFF